MASKCKVQYIVEKQEKQNKTLENKLVMFAVPYTRMKHNLNIRICETQNHKSLKYKTTSILRSSSITTYVLDDIISHKDRAGYSYSIQYHSTLLCRHGF